MGLEDHIEIIKNNKKGRAKLITKRDIFAFLEEAGIKHDDIVTGKVLLVGVGHERNTYLHSVDERLGIPDRLNPNPFEITIQGTV